MNIKEYMKNPAGKGAVIPGRESIMYAYEGRYNTMMKTKPIELRVYRDADVYYFHLVLITESEERENTYDVVLKFSPLDDKMKKDMSIRNYDMKVFSNCPSFTFTYAYVAKLNGILIKELEDKYTGKVLTHPPVTRNPSLLFSYEKSIYFACKYILDNNYILKGHINGSLSRKITKDFFKNIRNIDQIEEEIKKHKSINQADKAGLKPDIPKHQYQKPQYNNPKTSVKKVSPIRDGWKKDSTIGQVKKKSVKDSWKKKSTVKYIKKK